MAKLRFSPETDITISSANDDTVDEVHLNDLSFIADFDHENGEVIACEIDLGELTKAATLYSSMEKHRYSWRR